MANLNTDRGNDTVDILAPQSSAAARQRQVRIGSAAVGVLLAGVSAFSDRGSRTTRVMVAVAGGLLVARGITGLSTGQLARRVSSWLTTRRDLERRFNDGAHDIVDAASFDSFPASDPPSYSPGAG